MRIQVLFLCLLIHKSWTKQRSTLAAKFMCANRALLPIDQSFTPVSDVAECAQLFTASRASFMLVQHGASDAVMCGHTSTLPYLVTCDIKSWDISVYADSTKMPKCDLPCDAIYQLRGTVMCVHNTSATKDYPDSKNYCLSNFSGGALVELESRADIPLFQSLFVDFWVGADNYASPGTYNWASGATVDPAMFATGQPNTPNQPCALFHPSELGLHDQTCALPLPVVCTTPCQ